MKTFYTGVGGWADTQAPDGTITWTSPSGRSYTTKPGGALFFPILATPTGKLTIGPPTEAAEYRGLMMPRRRLTRYQEQRDRISAERAINETRLAEEHRQHQAWLAPPTNPRRSDAA